MSTLEVSNKKVVNIKNTSLSTYRTPFKKNLQDIFQTLSAWRVWVSMGWQDVRLRYKRTRLGPFWITITTFIFICSIAFIFGTLLNSSRANYLPHLASGYIAWTFISGMLGESCEVFNASQRYILQMNLPYTLYVMRMVFKNSVAFFHNLLPVIVLSIWYGNEYNLLHIFLLILGFFLVAFCGLFFGTIFACIGARFRDLKPGIQSIIRVCFFCTPIMWTKERFPQEYHYIINLNPFYHLIELIRRPLLGTYFSTLNLLAVLGMVVLGFFLMLLCLRRTRHRIAFWV